MTTRLLTARNIRREFSLRDGAVQALGTVTVEVSAGDFLIVTGPSGSGKSTLLNILSGFDRPSSGAVCFRGIEYSALDSSAAAAIRNGSFGFMYQTPHLLPQKTVRENVLLPFHYGAWTDPVIAENRCSMLLERVDMLPLQHRYPETLSGGEMQRVVFARALARQPEIIFADEPTGSLDSVNAEKLLTLLQQQAERGCAVVMVSHDTETLRYGNAFLQLTKSTPVSRRTG